MIYTALVPVKSLAAAKSRLAPYLSRSQRETLVLDMLHHTLSILLESKLLKQVSVVSPDARVLEQAHAWGAQPLMEEHHEHNAALQAAALRGDLFARRGGSGAVGGGIPVPQTGCPLGRPPSKISSTQQALLTISADLPLLQRHDIHALIEQAQQYQVVLAPSRDGTGTNAILVRPPLAVPYLFGPNSLQRYLDAAEQRHLSSTLCKSSGLGFDVDTIEDLHELQALFSELPGKTALAAPNL